MATRIKTQFKNNKQGWTSKLMTPKGVNTPYNGSYMNSKLGDVKVNNKSLEEFYGDKIKAYERINEARKCYCTTQSFFNKTDS